MEENDLTNFNKDVKKLVVGALIFFLAGVGCAKPMTATNDGSPTKTVSASDTSTSSTSTPTSAQTTTSTPSTEKPSQPPAEKIDCQGAKCIALTFDDGPGEFTEKLLDELKEANVKATFFLVGRNIAAHTDTVKRMVTEGHMVGNHSWNHPDFKRIGPAKAADQLDRTSAAIEQASGVKPIMARPPYGSFNDATPRQGMSFVLWSVDTLDWKNRSVEQTTKNALDQAGPGAIILMHDIHPTTVSAVPGLISKLKAQGYQFVTVPELYPGGLTPGQTYYGKVKSAGESTTGTGKTPSASPTKKQS